MIVDDQQDISYLYKLHLARLGFDSISFDNPLVALDHYQQNYSRYVLVLLDWTLPRMNGLELAKRMSKINSKVQILMISGYLVKEMVNEDEFMEANISEVLHKPVRFEDLAPSVIKLCNKV